MRITVADVLGWLAVGMTHEEILSDYPELTEEDIRAGLSHAADRERGVLIAARSCCSTGTSASPRVGYVSATTGESDPTPSHRRTFPRKRAYSPDSIETR